MNINLLKASVLMVVVFIMSTGLNAQVDEFQSLKTWFSIGFNKKINKKWQVGYSQLQSFSGKPFELRFIQAKIKLSYKLKSRMYIHGGYNPIIVIDIPNNDISVNHRFFTAFKVGMKLSKRWRMQHILTIEKNLEAGSKFKERFNYANKIYYRNKNLPLGLKPFLTQKIYWYQNGRPVQYYDAEQEAADRASPNGLHAYRIMAGLSIKPARIMSLTIYFMNQQEFNSSLFGGRDINVFNPKKSLTLRKFNNFSVLGISTSLNF